MSLLRTRPDSRWTLAAAVFCMAMLVLHVSAGLNSAGVADFWRDVYWATRIAHGEQFPLFGPPINNLLETGPWWFYLLALPLAITGRVASIAVFIQTLAAAKCLLAWRLGTRIVGPRFGFLFCVSVAAAGWSTVGFWFPSHPALVETTVLLLAFAVHRGWHRFRMLEALALGLAAAACLHAHPTTALYVVVAGMILLIRHRADARCVAHLAFAAVVITATLLPPLFDHSPALSSMQTSVAAYVGTDVGVNVLTRLPALLSTLFVGGAWIGFALMTKWSSSGATFAWYVFCSCLALAALGITWLAPEWRRLLAGSLALLFFQVLFLAVLRPFTPIWMVPSCLPPLTCAIAFGWYGWIGVASSVRRLAGLCVFAIYAVLSLAPFGLFLRHLHEVRVMNANPLIDVVDLGDAFSTVAVPFITVSAMERIAPTLCAPATLHGRLGALFETTSGSVLRSACGFWPDVRFSGQRAPHVAGYPADAVAAIGITPTRGNADIALYENVRGISPQTGTGIVGLRRMEVARRAPDEGKAVEFSLTFDTGRGEVVAITNRYPLFSALGARSAVVNGAPAVLRYTDGKGFVFACATCLGDRAHWDIELFGVVANVDVVSFGATASEH